ncbi:MAG: class I SAM-dependent methyltransferase [Lachnospiraceae bacterium]|nr:class I SAM-dependent methyltransferase [Lachnospiraceae bacterium]
MDAYGDFAYIYDRFMEEVPYEKWADLLASLIDSYGDGRPHDEISVTDLGCGTGRLTSLLNKKGFLMTGVDLSTDMLSVAMERNRTEGEEILYINQDMLELELLERADVILSSFDSINYIVTNEEMITVFSRIRENLKPNGLLLFDFNTVAKYGNEIGDRTIAEDRGDCAFIWENFYDPETHINEYDITFFAEEPSVKTGSGEPLFRRFTETHIQRGYTLSEMKEFLERAGLRFVTALDSDTRKAPDEKSGRIHLVARA